MSSRKSIKKMKDSSETMGNRQEDFNMCSIASGVNQVHEFKPRPERAWEKCKNSEESIGGNYGFKAKKVLKQKVVGGKGKLQKFSKTAVKKLKNSKESLKQENKSYQETHSVVERGNFEICNRSDEIKPRYKATVTKLKSFEEENMNTVPGVVAENVPKDNNCWGKVDDRNLETEVTMKDMISANENTKYVEKNRCIIKCEIVESCDIGKEVQINREDFEGVIRNSMEKCDDTELPVDVDGKVNNVPNETGKGDKRKRRGKQDDDDNAKPTKSAKKETDSSSQPAKRSKDKIPDVTSMDFANDSKTPGGNPWNFKISSWNVNGIRAWLEKNGISYLHHEKPDVVCIQETKCPDDKLPGEIKNIEGYHTYWLSGDKDGYSGVGLISKEEPIRVEYGIGISEHDSEGRVITAEYKEFYLIAAYVPNAGRKLVRLEYRMKWDEDFRAYVKKLDETKPVVLCGDLNVAHNEIDLANPKTNKKNAGFTKEEREGFSALLKEGFTDTFRQLYPDVAGAYTFWTYMMNARTKNVGWRLDYFVVSERFCENLCDSVIRKDVFGSDHCPITLFLSL